MQFTDEQFKQFRADLKAAVKELEKKYEVLIEPKKIKYDENSFDLNITVTKNEEGIDVEKLEFEKYCGLYGFEKQDYLKTFTISGREYELYGFNPRAKSQPCLIRDPRTGAHYKCSLNLFHLGSNHSHKCKYCGRLVNSENPDELCDHCKQTFGHSLYSEL